jgi:transposase
MTEVRNVTTLDGIKITGWDETPQRLIIDAEWTEPRGSIEACRQCGAIGATLHKHDWIERKVRDTPWGGKPLAIRLQRRRYRCTECGGTVLSAHPAIHDTRNMTSALVEKVRRDALGPYRFNMLAHQVGSSETPIRAIFRDHTRDLDERPYPVPLVLGIDEVHVPGNRRPHAVIADIWEGKAVEMLRTTRKRALYQYLSDLEDGRFSHRPVPPADKEAATFSPEEAKDAYWTPPEEDLNDTPLAVVIDMTPRYRAAIEAAMPDALVVVDRFHLLRQANRALGQVRVQESKRTRLETEWKRERKRLGKLKEQLGSMDRMMLEAAFERHPRMKRAYRARNQFRKIFALKSRQAADAALREWEGSLHPSIASAFEGVTRALENWRTEILNYFTARYTNGRVEGLNRAIQQIQAEGAGYSFEALRAKVIYGLERRREARERPTVHYSQFPPPPDVVAGHYGIEDPSDAIRLGVPFDRIADDLELW